ncbi:thermonuclease family protein [Modicisalibacter xianhensis]|uniref:Nuclease homologue n=1 Tax=Modicisalibacter xianhensis TaxID=442341 RepID=A0A1I3GAN4_9GAMM|nr:thermonuclease family protein [Halomonas xianhensis]SFI20474.1 nuclease homologue [Halomonas xianhensis]
MKRLLAFATLIPTLALADYGSATVSEVVAIYDGDTFTANVEGWPPVIGERIKIRVAGINAPERRSRCDTEADKAREKTLAADARVYVVERLRDAERIELRQIKRGSFFRLIADVYVDGESLGDQLIAAGLAIPYAEGQGGKAWCGHAPQHPVSR